MSSQISTEQTVQHLQLLGYQDGDRLFFRAINKPHGGQSTKLNSVFPEIPQQLSILNPTHGIYVVANGGGDKDSDVECGRAIWYEHDDRPKTEQVDLWRSLQLPEPTFQVDTGGKSVHSYWVFSEPVAIEHQPSEKDGGKGRCFGSWCDLQRDLLEYSNGDRSIKNPSRVMRLAGFKHQETGEYSQIVNRSGNRYSFDELRAIIPKPEPKKTNQAERKHRDDRPSPAVIKTHANSDPVSLRSFVTADNQTLIDRGASTNRNTAGTALSRDLIGCENWLTQRGVSVIEPARTLFDNFCFASNLPDANDPTECDRIWDSAMGDSPTPSCSQETLERVLGIAIAKCEPRHFESSFNEGLVLVTREQTGDGGFRPARHKIGNHLKALAYVNNPTGDGSSVWIEFKSLRNTMTRWLMPRGYIVSETAAMLAELTNRGYFFHLHSKKDLIEYLNGLGEDVSAVYTVTDNTGWVNGSFVLPHKTYGDQNLKFRDIEPRLENSLTEAIGTQQGWDSTVGDRLSSNSRLIFFGTGVPYAAPLMQLVDLEPGGFHIVGSTSKGKTTILRVAASIYGVKQITQWRSTVNGLEGIAGSYNDLCLLLDELGQAEARDVGAAIYMLGNGVGKIRNTKELRVRKPAKFRNLILSSGEVGIATYMKTAGQTIKGGQAVRLLDIPAVPPDSQYGCFENIGAAKDAVEFVNAIEAGTRANHGVVGDIYLTRLSADLENPEFTPTLVKRVDLAAADLSRAYGDEAIGRAAKRFALVQVALGLAHSYGLLPIPIDQIAWSVRLIFEEWIKERGGDGSIDIRNTCDQIGHILTTQENGERFFTLPENDGKQTRNQIGYRKLSLISSGGNGTIYGGTEELWVFPEVFRRELCEGGNPTEIARELVNRGWLTTGQSGNVTQTQKIKGGVQRFYCFRKWEFLGVTTVTGVTPSPEMLPEVTLEKSLVLPVLPGAGEVTPVTPKQEGGVTSGNLSQQQVTPVTVVTPEKTNNPNSGTPNFFAPEATDEDFS